MKIVLYFDRNITEKKINQCLNSIKYYLKNSKLNYEIIPFKKFKLVKADYAIMWNVYCKFKSNTKYRKLIKDFQKKNKDKLIIAELGFINRQNYFSLGYDHISNFGNYPKFPNNQDRLNKLKLNIKNIEYDNNINKPILFCTQVPWDTQIQDINYPKWVVETIKKIKLVTNRKIIIRKHPKHNNRKGFPLFNEEFFKRYKISINLSKNSLQKDLNDCYCVIAFNSTVLVDAILAGKPIITDQTSSIIYDLAEHDFNNIENLKKITIDDIKNSLIKISYKQWTINEIKLGLPFKYLIKK